MAIGANGITKKECAVCGYSCDGAKNGLLDLHHIIPKGKGGDNRPENLVYLCKSCHGLTHLVLRTITEFGDCPFRLWDVVLPRVRQIAIRSNKWRGVSVLESFVSGLAILVLAKDPSAEQKDLLGACRRRADKMVEEIISEL